jgi:hypothetical protein
MQLQKAHRRSRPTEAIRMIDRQHGKVVLECDSCDEVYDANTDDFGAAWAAAKRDGWRTKKIGSE